jgi:hypothetical protein
VINKQHVLTRQAACNSEWVLLIISIAGCIINAIDAATSDPMASTYTQHTTPQHTTGSSHPSHPPTCPR